MKRLFGTLAVLFLICVLLLGCEEPTKPEIVRPVKFMKLEKIVSLAGNRYPGRAEASTELNLGFEVSGTIELRPVDKGDMVKKGQLMAVLDLRDFKNEVAFAMAERKRNLAYRNRIAEALKSNAVSRQDLTDADARLEQSRAAVRIKQKAFEDAHIKAPFDGTVSWTYKEAGQRVQAKENVLRLLDVSKIEFTVNVPEQIIPNIDYVKDITITFDAFSDRPIPARIKEVGTEASAGTRTYPVTLVFDQLEDIKIMPGMAGVATGDPSDFPNQVAQNEFLLPVNAFFSPDGKIHKVWLLDEATMGVIIGTGLILTILGTFVGMTIAGYPFQRMTLGALIIAMGMMVDNSIVVADGIQVRINQGMDRVKAAIEAATKPSLALLGATVIAVMAFYPIFASKADAGEYCRSLFVVVAMSLGLSWLLALIQTPLQCLDILPKAKPSKEGEEEKDPFDNKFFNAYRWLLETAIRFRWPFMAVMIALLVAAVYNFQYVKREYFPYASRNQIMVDFWFDEGTPIEVVAERTRLAEQKAMEHPDVTTVSVFLGKGPPRLYLPVDPELPHNNHYAEMTVNTNTFDEINPFIAEYEPWIKEAYPDITTRVRKYGVGPSDTWKFEWHITGPAEADVAFLREIGEKAKAILRKEPRAKEIKTSLMNRREKIVPVYDQPRGRWAGIQRDDIADATKRAYDGFQVGLYRQGDDLYPILLRHEPEERRTAADNLQLLQIRTPRAARTVPLAQVTKDIRVEFEEPFINRWDRHRTVCIQATPQWWTTYPDLKKHV